MAEYVLRAAERRDNTDLIALERRSPLIVGDIELAFDRSPDYFAGQQLQERSRMVVAVADGTPIGVSASAVHTATLLGEERLLAYTHHMRVAPEYQRHGVGRALGAWLRDSWAADGVKTDRGYAFIDASNADSLAFATSRPGPGPWPIDGWLQDLPAADPSAADGAESVGPDEIDDVVDLHNRTHAGLELFDRYTAERLAARLARSPRYGWAQWRGLRRGGRLVAVAGVYDQGAGVAAITRDRRSGAVTVSRALTVLDYGFSDAGAMADLLLMLRGMAAAMARQTVQISVPGCSALYERAMADAAHAIRFKFLAGDHPPSDYPLRGVYIDPAYL